MQSPTSTSPASSIGLISADARGYDGTYRLNRSTTWPVRERQMSAAASAVPPAIPTSRAGTARSRTEPLRTLTAGFAFAPTTKTAVGGPSSWDISIYE